MIEKIGNGSLLRELGKHKKLYQSLFEEMVDLGNSTLWSNFILRPSEFISSNRKLEKLERDERNLEIIFEKARKSKINEIVLLVIYLQYVTADVYDKERNKKQWVLRVLNRKPVDSFPDHDAIIAVLEKTGYIERTEEV